MEESLKDYIRIFTRIWNAYLHDDLEMRATIHVGPDHIAAVEFFPCDAGDPWDVSPKSDTWESVAERVTGDMEHVIPGSGSIFVYDDAVIVVKGTDAGGWTEDAARKDATASIWKRGFDELPAALRE